MENITKTKVPALFWIIAIVAVMWNLVGVMAYVMQVTMTDEAMAALPEAEQALYAAQPAWVTGAFAIAVFAGLCGSVALALRSGLATTIFAVSLVAVIVQMIYVFALSDMLEVMGATGAVLPSSVAVIATALLWFSTYARDKRWTG